MNPLSTDGTEEKEQVPPPESPVTEVVENSINSLTEEKQKEAPVAAQVEENVAASVEGLSKGLYVRQA